uniref:JmjC domain-containing protein n=1 Tax=Chlamydomonas leiostraca TaxID=1034604 RepID=A0A7S0WZB7_9CHLO|mmetsp:Transcript_38172/g.96603  ORF Transcript_38172/g.96603 Transcript_38172/m.96603 type:complete len:804 (+) Transcript_38172:101-2512(+)
MAQPKPTPKPPKLQWSSSLLADWQPGQKWDVDPYEHSKPEERAKRARLAWQDKPRTFHSLYHENKQRVEDCWTKCAAMQTCRDLAEELHQALEKAPLEDLRPNAAGEKSRIFSRAQAMKRVLEKADPTLVSETATDATEEPGSTHDPSKLTSRQHTNKQMRIQRSSNEAEPDATPDQCVMSVCLLMAALYEQTPFTQGDVRKRIYSDFTLLKRHFRQDELVVLHGRSGPVRELFDSIKDLDKRGGLQNLIGIRFEDWKVYDRVSKFIMAEELEAQVTAITSEGPVGKFVCRLHTFVTLCTLHMRLTRELFAAAFADTHPPKGQNEWMTSKDELDFVDFTEAMARNTPFRHAPREPQFYCWMYAPEVNAPTDMLERIFGKGACRLPAMNDACAMPDDAVHHVSPEEGYSLDVDRACQVDWAEETSSLCPVGYPWCDDLLGAYFDRIRRQGGRRPPGSKASAQGNGHTHGSTPTPAVKQEQPPMSAAAGVVSQQAGSIKSEHQSAPGATPVANGQAHANGGAPAATAAPERKAALHNAEETGRLALPLGMFLVGIICSGSYTNTQIHVEDLLLMSINLNIFGAPKVWWWLPQEAVQAFKEYGEEMTEGGRRELYTKSISPFLLDNDTHTEHLLPLTILRDIGAKRALQMPGMAVLTMPGYAFHFTTSIGFNIAESANLFLEVMGWTFEKLWLSRPVEQYSSDQEEDDMAKYLHDTGVLATLGIPYRKPRHAAEVHRELAPRVPGGFYQDSATGKELRRCLVNPDHVKYVAMPPPMPVFKMDAKGTVVPVPGSGATALPPNVVITV